MSDQELEHEVKFYVLSLENIESQIRELDGCLTQPRTLEYNLLFDDEEGELTTKYQILRLRKDNHSTLTYKGPGEITGGIYSRKEIEIEVSSFEHTKSLLEALGFHVSLIYEKFRTVYNMEGVIVSLDEMPIGDFIEVEGRDRSEIKNKSLELGLYWEERILKNYVNLFQDIQVNICQRIENLAFSDFKEIKVTPEMMGIFPADG